MAQPKGQSIVGLLLLGFVTIVVGLNLLVPITNTITAQNILTTYTNETVTITSGTGTTANTINSLSFVGNASGVQNSISGLGIGTSINFTGKTITVPQNLNVSVGAADFNRTFSNGSYNVTYTNKGPLYVDNPTAQTIDSLVIIFMALGVITVGVGIVLAGFREAGLLI